MMGWWPLRGARIECKVMACSRFFCLLAHSQTYVCCVQVFSCDGNRAVMSIELPAADHASWLPALRTFILKHSCAKTCAITTTWRLCAALEPAIPIGWPWPTSNAPQIRGMRSETKNFARTQDAWRFQFVLSLSNLDV